MAYVGAIINRPGDDVGIVPYGKVRVSLWEHPNKQLDILAAIVYYCISEVVQLR